MELRRGGEALDLWTACISLAREQRAVQRCVPALQNRTP